MAAKKKTAAAPEAVPTPASAAPDGVRYQSIRLKEQGHKLRFSHGPKLVESKGDQTVTYLALPYPHFRVDPGGVEFPLENVASAIQTEASIAQKLSRTGRINLRKQAQLQALKERRKKRAETEVQVVDDEDDEPLPLEVDPDDVE